MAHILHTVSQEFVCFFKVFFSFFKFELATEKGCKGGFEDGGRVFLRRGGLCFFSSLNFVPPVNFVFSLSLVSVRDSGHRTNDIRVARVGDRENSDAEVTAARSPEVDVRPVVVVDSGPAQMSVVLNLRPDESRAVARNDNKLCCACAMW